MRRWKVALSLVWLLLFLCPAASRAVSLSFAPASSTASVGDMVQVDVVIGGLSSGGPPSVGGFDLDVTYDSSILNFQSATFGGFLGVPGLQTITASGPIAAGVLDVFEVSLLAPAALDGLQPGSFLLATLSFQATNPGISSLGFSQGLVSDSFSSPLAATLGSGDMTILPEPRGVLILANGLLVLLMVRRVSNQTARCSRQRHTRPW